MATARKNLSPVKKTAAAKKVVTAAKAKTQKVEASKKTQTKTVKKESFPTKELSGWLKERQNWNHNDWLSLLDTIKAKGYGHLTETDEGKHQIGEFLEANRGRSC